MHFLVSNKTLLRFLSGIWGGGGYQPEEWHKPEVFMQIQFEMAAYQN